MTSKCLICFRAFLLLWLLLLVHVIFRAWPSSQISSDCAFPPFLGKSWMRVIVWDEKSCISIWMTENSGTQLVYKKPTPPASYPATKAKSTAMSGISIPTTYYSDVLIVYKDDRCQQNLLWRSSKLAWLVSSIYNRVVTHWCGGITT
jgi:hypothetical protein